MYYALTRKFAINTSDQSSDQSFVKSCFLQLTLYLIIKMLLPPSTNYKSANKLFQDVQTFANSQGYALVKKRTRKDRYGELKNKK